MVVSFTASTDFAGRGKRLATWSLSAGGTAIVVNFRNGGAAGPVQFQIRVPINTSASQAYNSPLYFNAGVYVELVSGVLNNGMVDLL